LPLQAGIQITGILGGVVARGSRGAGRHQHHRQGAVFPVFETPLIGAGRRLAAQAQPGAVPC
jgi:hypothetical protein